MKRGSMFEVCMLIIEVKTMHTSFLIGISITDSAIGSIRQNPVGDFFDPVGQNPVGEKKGIIFAVLLSIVLVLVLALFV